MTREEHIEKAEQLLAGTWETRTYSNVGAASWEKAVHVPPTEYEVAVAQVHATLALAIPSTVPTTRARALWNRAVTR